MKLNSRFLEACYGEETDAVPIWLMRQAGRYMAEYRELRQHHGILDIIKTPELAKEVTLQPINAFDLDAGIIFADILPPLEAMGLDLEFVSGVGPVIHNPVRTVEDAEQLQVPDPQDGLGFTIKAVEITAKELAKRDIPLIGFSGAPFTLAYYAIEGQASQNKLGVKAAMHAEPELWDILMNKLATLQGNYLKAQAEAGAQVLQVFDSWAGILSPYDYREYVKPYTQKVVKIAKQADVPVIHFGTTTSAMLPEMKDAGGDIIGVDWRIDIDKAADILGDDVIIQGNLDPAVLLAPWEEIEKQTKYILDKMRDRPGYIFNLGHGIHRSTPPEQVRKLATFVHEYTKK